MFYNPLLSNYQQLIFNICTFVFTQPVKLTEKKEEKFLLLPFTLVNCLPRLIGGFCES